MGAFRRLSDDTIEIKRMRTKPDMWGRGIGGLMLDALEREAKVRGYTRACLDTTVIQLNAQRLYTSRGYRESHRESDGWPLETIFYEKEL